MNKLKISPGLAGIVLLACLFSGWQTLLIVVILMLLFCDVDDKIKNLITKIVAFYAALTIFSTAWSLLTDAFDVAVGIFNKVLATINSYLGYANQLDVSGINNYVLTPLTNLVNIADSIVVYLLALIKFMFIITTIKNQPVKENAVINKINEFVTKIINYINNLDFGTPVTANANNVNPVQNTTTQTSSVVQPSNVVNPIVQEKDVTSSTNGETHAVSESEQPKEEQTPQS